MRESYKRFVKTWIRFANPDFLRNEPKLTGYESIYGVQRFVSWIRFVDSFRGFVSWIRFVDSF